MKGIDKYIIRDILDEMHVATSFDDDGDLMVVQQADEDFVYDVVIYIIVNTTAARTCRRLSCATATCAWSTVSCSTKR